MAISDTDIDRLFQLPLDEFTAARNALAKHAGPDAAAIRRLHRPHAAAWAVNQLYWRRRQTFDRLVTASERLRSAHAQTLRGGRADLAAAEQAHREALKAATNEIREVLTESGEKASAATMTAVSETLRALPRDDEAPGRLVRPLKPLGFEALAGLMGRTAAGPARKGEVVPFDRGRQTAGPDRKPDAAARRREEQAHAREEAARKREAARIEKQLAKARAAEREAQREATRARQAADRAERDRDRAEEALTAATEALRQAKKDAEQKHTALTTAAGERSRLERALDEALTPS
jgi:hypothetical protein